MSNAFCCLQDIHMKNNSALSQWSFCLHHNVSFTLSSYLKYLITIWLSIYFTVWWEWYLSSCAFIKYCLGVNGLQWGILVALCQQGWNKRYVDTKTAQLIIFYNYTISFYSQYHVTSLGLFWKQIQPNKVSSKYLQHRQLLHWPSSPKTIQRQL